MDFYFVKERVLWPVLRVRCMRLEGKVFTNSGGMANLCRNYLYEKAGAIAIEAMAASSEDILHCIVNIINIDIKFKYISISCILYIRNKY